MPQYGHNLLPRVWLTGVAIAQIILTPIIAFSITYLFWFDFSGESFQGGINVHLVEWIVSASLFTGMTALLLALFVGGFTPNFIIKQGGWLSALRLTGFRRDAEHISNAKMKHQVSPYGKLIKLVSDKLNEGYSLLGIHGGLQLLAIPLQLILVITPWLLLIIFESSAVGGRHLEFVLITYVMMLIISLKVFPIIATKFIVTATFTRRWIYSMTKLSWLAPVLVLWMLGRVASVIVIGGFGDSIDISSEQGAFSTFVNSEEVPKNSFLDLMTALSVLPLAAFTTLAVLGGGNRILPAWLKIDEGWDAPENDSTSLESAHEEDILDEENHDSSSEGDLDSVDEIAGDE